MRGFGGRLAAGRNLLDVENDFQYYLFVEVVLLVCHCNAVCDRTIRECIRDGAKCVDDVARSCQAGSGCGGCHEVIEELLAREHGRSEDAHIWQIALASPKAA
jgi:bacterioferritin-associated ferredoxin